MLEIVNKLNDIFKLLYGALKTKQAFEYKFLTVNGTEPNPQIKIANSITYEFINSGNSICILNDQLKIYPKWCGIEPTRVLFQMNKNEQDVGVYEYRFEDVPNGLGVAGLLTNAAGFNSGLVPYSNIGAVAPFNSLQVIIKQNSVA